MTDDKNDDRLIAPGDPITALSLLSRLPLPVWGGERGAKAAWAYSLAGLIVGGLAALIGGLSQWIGLPAPLCALLTLTTLVMLTGAMHEDGLADAADGLWGGWDRAVRLEIMRDSRVGSYGVIALVLSLAARLTALWLLFDIGFWAAATGLIVSATLSRAAMPVVMATLPHARKDGLSHRVGHVSGATASLGVIISLVIVFTVLHAAALWPLMWGAIVVAVFALIAKRKIGGQTGDILGASQQLAEIAVLFALLA